MGYKTVLINTLIHLLVEGKMIELTDGQVARYFHRCYTAADGLWFMKVEEKYGFDAALDIDNEVWKVLPKIQPRMLKPMVKTEGMDALLESVARADAQVG